MFKKITLVLFMFATFAMAADINVKVDIDKPNYRIGQTVNWTIKAWASSGDNRGVAALSVNLTESQEEGLNLPMMDGPDFLGTDYGTLEGFTTVVNYVYPAYHITSMGVVQLGVTPDIGNDGSEKVLSQGSYTVGVLGSHTLDAELEGALYYTAGLVAVPFENASNVVDAVFGVYNRADINYDGNVDIDDLAILSSEWLATGPALQADIEPVDGDGIVDLNDFALLAEEWLITN